MSNTGHFCFLCPNPRRGGDPKEVMFAFRKFVDATGGTLHNLEFNDMKYDFVRTITGVCDNLRPGNVEAFLRTVPDLVERGLRAFVVDMVHVDDWEEVLLHHVTSQGEQRCRRPR